MCKVYPPRVQKQPVHIVTPTGKVPMNAKGKAQLVRQLRSCADAGDVKTGEETLDLLEQMFGIQAVDIYNSMIHVCAKAKNVNRAAFHFKRMERLSLRPSSVTYNTILNACAALGDATSAAFWYQHMQDNGIVPNCVTYGTMCKVFARKGMVQQIQDLMNAIEVDGGTLNEYFYACLISACAMAQPAMVQPALQAVGNMAERGLGLYSIQRPLARVIGKRQSADFLLAVGGAATDEVRSTVNSGSETTCSSKHVEDRIVASDSEDSWSTLTSPWRSTFAGDEISTTCVDYPFSSTMSIEKMSIKIAVLDNWVRDGEIAGFQV